MGLDSVLLGLEERLDRAALIRTARIVNDAYNTFMLDVQVWELAASAFGPDLKSLLERYSRHISGHRFVSELLMQYYPAERVIKYHFVREHLMKLDEVTVFEMYVDTSRVDVARVNGESFAYEVKTEYDRLDKLTKQIDDYAKVFEHVEAVVHPRHLPGTLERVPEYCGIQTYRQEGAEVVFETVRPPGRSPHVDSEAQVRNLSSNDLAFVLKSRGVAVPGKKEERAMLALRQLEAGEINNGFKLALKQKFQKRWAHVQRHFNRIEPIDVQSFYTAQADPAWVYYSTSLSV